MLRFIVSVIVSLWSVIAFSDLPENDLWREDSLFQVKNDINDMSFNYVVDQMQKLYAPIVRYFGATLIITGDWADPTVNAYTYRDGDNWHIDIFGGLARRQEMTLDALQLVICHELGHQIAGVPLKGWASAEGQSDYYATHVCGKKVFSGSRIRNLDASLALASLLATLGNQKKPSFETPDRTVVSKTNLMHPKAQCRLDTYYAGAVCNMKWDDKIVPRAYNYVCDNRPKCWYAKQTF